MNRQLIIHIGLPKTGSTAAQTFFARNREALLSHSIDYLPIGEFYDGQIGRIASGNGAYLARSMLPKGDGAYLRWEEDRVRDALLAGMEGSKANKILLSSELFSLPDVSAWSNIADIANAGGLDLCFIAAVRNHCDWLTSAYLQGVKRHHVTDEPAPYIRQLYKSTRFLRYETYFRTLSELCAGRIHLVSYDQGTARGQLLDLFQRSLGIGDDLDLVGKRAKANITPNPEEIAFIRHCNVFRPRMGFSDILISAGVDFSKIHEPWSVIDSDLRKEVSDFFADEVTGFVARFGLERSFFSEACSKYVDLDAISTSSERCVDLLGRYLVSFDDAIETLRRRVGVLEGAAGRNG